MRLASHVGVAGLIELVCGVLIAIGLAAGYAAFLASGTMAVAYFKAHAPRGLLPIVNKGELAVVYCFLFLYIATRGPGTWSVDSAIKRCENVLQRACRNDQPRRRTFFVRSIASCRPLASTSLS